jgi:hypothetical protein
MSHIGIIFLIQHKFWSVALKLLTDSILLTIYAFTGDIITIFSFLTIEFLKKLNIHLRQVKITEINEILMTVPATTYVIKFAVGVSCGP